MAPKLSIPALEKALEEKRQKLENLKSKRDKLEKELDDVGKEIAKLEGGGGGGRKKKTTRRGRKQAAGGPKGEGLDVLVPKVLAEADKPLRMREIAETCKGLGYETSSKNFSNVVAQYVYKDDNIVRVGRGLYTLKDKADEMKAVVEKQGGTKKSKTTKKKSKTTKSKTTGKKS